MDQPTLFDAIESQRRADEGMTRADTAAAIEWKESARMAISWLARSRPNGFTADDVWEYLHIHNLPTTHEPAALGALFKTAAREGLIVGSSTFIPSKRPEAHARPMRVWKGRQ